MQRDLDRIQNTHFDIAVIGGGIYGASLAWEAASRGLSVALLEKDDFASATSANSLKTIHGGFRYLQHADLPRMRASMRERRALMRTAPHLVHPLPVLVPIYGHGIKGRETMTVALALNDLVAFDRNRLPDPQKHIPRGRMLSRQECLHQVPGINPQGLTGGAVFYDAQVYNSERLVLAFLHSAAEAGAALANYAQVTGLARQGADVTGVEVQDTLDGGRFEVRARLVVNAAGPWINRVIESEPAAGHSSGKPLAGLAAAFNLVTRPLFPPERGYAVGLMGKNSYQDRRALVKKSSSLLFVAPWRGRSIVGTTYKPYTGDPADFAPTEQDVLELLAAINQAYPGANLEREDVTHVHAGLLPALEGQTEDGDVRLANHYTIHDHGSEGAPGLLSVVGVKYTTARDVASKVITRAFKLLGRRPAPSVSADTPLHGGEIEHFDPYLKSAIQEQPCGLAPAEVTSLVYNYGSAYKAVLRYFEASQPPGKAASDLPAVLLRAQVLYAVRAEMALKLADVVYRRTDLGTAEQPSPETLHLCAQVMAEELGWSDARISQELQAVGAPAFLPSVEPSHG